MVNDIDLVIPMVFPQDPVWQREYQRFHGNPAAARHNVRFRSWGTEELLIRCCMKYMPWLRTIHILLASESQRAFLKTPNNQNTPSTSSNPTLAIHYHPNFIPHDYLPCFASPCIEMFLHRIPGLPEHFIYSNDDIFPLSPLSPEDFFRSKPDGGNSDSSLFTFHSSLLPCQRLAEHPFPSQPNILQRKCQYQENMIGAPFHHHATRTWLKNGHSFAPILRSVCEEVHHRHADEILRHLSPLRRTDHSHNHYIYTLYQHFAGMTVPHAPRQQYVGRATPTASLPALIADPTCGILCLNDNETIDDWQRRAEVVRKAIAQKLSSD